MDFVCPYKCSYRTNSGYCGSTGGWERCQYSQYMQLYQPNTVVGYVPPLKQTNADRIRAMTDEELADELLDYFAAFYSVEWSREELVKWLKQECE